MLRAARAQESLSTARTDVATMSCRCLPPVCRDGGWSSCATALASSARRRHHLSVMLPAEDALSRLRDGNRRFASGLIASRPLADPARRSELVSGQAPFAIVLGCSDSRVPAEIVFDQGLGDIFVIRVAGNIIAPSLVGSVEFAAAKFGTRLVVVLGHTHCGAIQATLDELERPSERRSPNLHAIVDRIRPSVASLLETDLRHERDALVRHAVRANIRASADHLRHGSAIIEDLIATDGLLVLGAEYDLETGLVEFFDGVAPTPNPSPDGRGANGGPGV
jgi:carbonic anhydrase